MRPAFALICFLAVVLGACHLVSGLNDFEPTVGSGGGTGGEPPGGASPSGGGGSAGGGGFGGQGGSLPCTAPGTDDIPCTGEVIWAKPFTSTGDTYIRGIDVAEDGTIYVVGFVGGDANFGLEPIAGEAGGLGFLLALDPDGTPKWQRLVTGNAYQNVTAVGAVPGGGVAVAGVFVDEAYVGGDYFDNLDTTNVEDVFVARFGAGGDLQWAHHLGGADDETVYDLAVDAQGRVAIVGDFEDEIVIPGAGAPLTEAGNNNGVPRNDAFVALRAADGAHLWAFDYGNDDNDQEAFAVHFANDGNLLVAGDFAGTIDFGLDLLDNQNGTDAFAVKLAASDGSAQWQTWIKGAGQEEVRGLRLCPDDSVALAGVFTTNVFVGDDMRGSATPSGWDMFYARLDADGAFAASDSVGGTIDATGYYRIIGCDPDGRLVIAGAFDEELSLGGELGGEPVGGNDIYVAKLDELGGAFWVQTFGSADDEEAKNLAIDPADGSILVTGTYDESLTIGDDTFQQEEGGSDEAFLIRLAP